MSQDPSAYQALLDSASADIKEYRRFLRSLERKKGIGLERELAQAEQDAFRKVDCTDCARCCRSLGPRLTPGDTARLARRFRQRPGDFEIQWCRIDEDGDTVFHSMPCPFLCSDGLCSVYEDRPRACRDYPHLSKGTRRMGIHVIEKNLKTCPVVILAVKELRKTLE